VYSVDDKDYVVELVDVPRSSVGAPCPMILAGEGYLYVAFFVEDTSTGWDGRTVRVVGEDTTGEPVALVSFVRPSAHLFGPPNDEAFSGHPLAARGLHSYGIFEIRESSWIRTLEHMNSVHPRHRAEPYSALRHFVFSFHDTTFECVAREFTITLRHGSVAGVLHDAFHELRGKRA
jgi:hypothetical protein